jgi:hypothetical protein
MGSATGAQNYNIEPGIDSRLVYLGGRFGNADLLDAILNYALRELEL